MAFTWLFDRPFAISRCLNLYEPVCPQQGKENRQAIKTVMKTDLCTNYLREIIDQKKTLPKFIDYSGSRKASQGFIRKTLLHNNLFLKQKASPECLCSGEAFKI
jgi:hypothetical protein